MRKQLTTQRGRAEECPLEKIKIQVLQTIKSNQYKLMVIYRGKHSK